MMGRFQKLLKRPLVHENSKIKFEIKESKKKILFLKMRKVA